MTVSTSAYTTNSKKITITNELSSTNIISALDAAIVALGWTAYDTVATTTFSPIITKVYRAINADTVTYKYAIVRIDTIKQTINLSTCESWDAASTHTPTNECWTNSGGFAQNYDIKDCFIFVSATVRHLVLWTFIKNEPGMWTTVMEFERVAAEDTTVSNVPCWAYTNSLMIGTPSFQALNTSSSQIMLAFCRTADGFTGAAAAKVYAPTTSRGMFPPSYPSATLAVTVDVNLLHLASYYNITYGWDSLKTVVSPIAVDAITKSQPLGRAYNFGVTKPLGGFLDSTLINIDSSGGWPSAAGSSTECLLLPMNGGCEADAAYAAGKLSVTYGQGTAAVFAKAIPIGSTVWLAASDGIRTYDVNTGQGGATTLRYANASGIQDIVYDGLQTIYGSTSNGIVKVDTESFNATTITTITNGTSYLGIDQKYVYAVDRTTSTAPKAYMIARSTFTVNAGQYTSGTALTVATGLGTPVPDYLGNCYVASQGGTLSSQTMRISSFVADTGVQAQNVVNPRVPAATLVTPESPTSFYIDPITNRIYLVTGFATTGNVYELSTALATLQSTTTFTTAGTGTASLYAARGFTGTVDYLGDMNIMPFRGTFLVSPKKVGLISAVLGYTGRIYFNSPSAATPGNTNVGAASVVNTSIASNPAGYGSVTTTNGQRVFSTTSVTLASDNRINVITGVYNLTTVGGYQAGRLTVKG